MNPHHIMLISYLFGLLFYWPVIILLIFIHLFLVLIYDFGFISGKENDRKIRRAMLSEDGREQINEINQRHELFFRERIAPVLIVFNLFLIWVVTSLTN